MARLKTGYFDRLWVKPRVKCERAVNFLNAIGQGRTLQELKFTIVKEIKKHRSELDVLTTGLVEAGVAVMQDAGG